MEIAVDADASSGPLKLDCCPDCGYMLRGLPTRSSCPECGFKFDADMMVLYGWGTGHRSYIASSGRCLLVLLPSITFCCIALAIWLRSLAIDITMCLLWLLLAVLAARRWRQTHCLNGPPAPHQLRLFGEGFAQREGFGHVELRPWYRRRQSGPLPVVYIEDRDFPGSGESKRLYHFCIATGPFADLGAYGPDCVDILVDLSPQILESIRNRLQGWEVLASAEQNERFWERYEAPGPL